MKNSFDRINKPAENDESSAIELTSNTLARKSEVI